MAPNNLWGIISECRNIFKAHRRHFHTLTLIFLFPLSLSLLLSPTLSHLFNHFLTTQQTTDPTPTSLLYSLFLSLFSYSGVISITYSVFHFFHGQPVKLISAIKSISTSFFPLFATNIVTQVIFFFISLFYALLLVLLIYGAGLVHVTVPYSSPYIFAFFAALPLLFVLIYLEVNWILVPVIVVVESCWGLKPLRRSTRLIRGMKGVALSSMLFFGFFAAIFVLNCFFVKTGYNGKTENWVSAVGNWVIIVANSYFLAMVMLSKIATNTVLYIYCKANHGEIAEGFGKDYVSLPLHDDNVSHAV